MKIVVTQDHIDMAKDFIAQGKSSNRHCPIALAINGRAWTHHIMDENNIIYKNTKPIKEFISKFDKYIPVSPSVFIVKKETTKLLFPV
jgi:hypothetical protein